MREQAQTVEAIAGRLVPKQNFRRLIAAQDLVEETGETAREAQGRPAKLFRFRPAVLAERDVHTTGLPCVEVKDTRQALGALARGWRSQFQIPLVAVTGSNGKTTVTQMIASILRAWVGDASLATQGNFNNDIGVPLTLMRLRATHRCAVVELGMNHPGEIAVLADWARPTVALVNNAQREHQEFMATVQAVARENGAVLQALPSEGVAVFPAADDYTALWQSMAGARRCITFGDSASADVRVVQELLGHSSVATTDRKSVV